MTKERMKRVARHEIRGLIADLRRPKMMREIRKLLKEGCDVRLFDPLISQYPREVLQNFILALREIRACLAQL